MAACAKGKEAPTAGGRSEEGAVGSAAHAPEPVMAPPPPPVATGPGNAADHAKSDSVLGPTTDTHAFDPIGGTGNAEERARSKDTKQVTQAATETPKTAPPPKGGAPDVRVIAVTSFDERPRTERRGRTLITAAARGLRPLG